MDMIASGLGLDFFFESWVVKDWNCWIKPFGLLFSATIVRVCGCFWRLRFVRGF